MVTMHQSFTSLPSLQLENKFSVRQYALEHNILIIMWNWTFDDNPQQSDDKN